MKRVALKPKTRNQVTLVVDATPAMRSGVIVVVYVHRTYSLMAVVRQTPGVVIFAPAIAKPVYDGPF